MSSDASSGSASAIRSNAPLRAGARRRCSGASSFRAVLRPIGLRGSMEAVGRRAHDAGTDLPAVPSGDPHIHGGRYTGIHHFEDVNAGGRAAVTEIGNFVV